MPKSKGFFKDEEFDIDNPQQAKEFYDRMKWCYLSKTRDIDTAEDLASTAMLDCLQSKRRHGKSIIGHFLKIYKDTLADYYRNHERVRSMTHELINEEDAEGLEGLTANLPLEYREECPELMDELEKIVQRGVQTKDTALIYRLVLEKKIEGFPKSFWKEDLEEKTKIIVRYLRILWDLPEKEMWKQKRERFEEAGLSGLIRLYPSMEEFLETGIGERKEKELIPYRTKWGSEETDAIAKEAIQSMTTELISRGRINHPGQLRKRHFVEYGLFGLYQTKFGNDKSELIRACFPEFDPSEIEYAKTRGDEYLPRMAEKLRDFLKEQGVTPENAPTITKKMFRRTPFWKLFHKVDGLYGMINLAWPNHWTEKDFEKQREKS